LKSVAREGVLPRQPILAYASEVTRRRTADFLAKAILLHEQMHELAPGPAELWLQEGILKNLYAIRDRLLGPPERP
jgi:hypothetical protein